MPGRRIVALLLVLYLAVDLTTPWMPGVFSYEDDDFFIDMIQSDATPVRLAPPTFAPPAMTVALVLDVAPSALARATVAVDARGHDGARRHPAERSAPPPSSLEDH
jgi:hypothetical protein